MARVLIVKDKPSIAMALEDDLRREGHHVEAGDGRRGGLPRGRRGPL